MSKITNDRLTRSGTGCFIVVKLYPYGNSGRQGVKFTVLRRLTRGTRRWDPVAFTSPA